VEERQHGLGHGAFAYYVKEPTTDGLKTVLDRLKDFSARRTKRLLIVEDNEMERQSIMELLDYRDIEILTVTTGGEAIDALSHSAFDCMVLDLRLPDMTGFALLERLHSEPVLADIPVVVFTGKELTASEQAKLKSMAKSIVMKDVESPERLLDETALFLHRVIADLPTEKQAMIERIHGSNEVLRGRKVLVVDDDARNIFALVSLLENQHMEVVSATSGLMALDIIDRTSDLAIVLMDIMMPDMDGYATIRKMRGDLRFRTLPILALTAKAMTGDREKCLDAGASDYISKPVNTDQLLSLMRVWLFR
jgi:CheY-like chemotaxis protein